MKLNLVGRELKSKFGVNRASLFYGTDRNGTEQFRHIILRNGTGSNMYATAHAIFGFGRSLYGNP